MSENKKIFATPKIRKFARELGANISEIEGSWIFEFEHSGHNITVEKGSITVNGVSLTIVEAKENIVSVAIIPYTFNNTNFRELEVGSKVNLEFDILGKYISKLIKNNKIL